MLTVQPVYAGTVSLPASHPAGPGPCTVNCFLVRADGRLILVDTGIGHHTTIIDHYAPTDHNLLDHLRAVGVEPRDIDAVVNSHLHFDHCGHNRAFRGKPVYVQKAELNAAEARGYTIAEWVATDRVAYSPVRGDLALSPNVTLLTTPGHSPGHQSVLVRDSDHVHLIAAQATFDRDEWRAQAVAEFAPADAANPQLYQLSLRKLRLFEPTHVYFTHDPQVLVTADTAASVDPVVC